MIQIKDLLANVDLMKLIYSITVIITLSLIYTTASRLLHKKMSDMQKFYVTKRNLKYVQYGLMFLILLAIWSDKIDSMSTYLGLLSAGLAIALKDFVVNMASWLFIIWRRPFEVGDRIEINNIAGDVIDLRLFQFTLNEIGNWVDGDQSTGRIIHIPNYKVLTEAMYNYSKGFHHIWNEINVIITFESNWEKAKNLLQNIADENSVHITNEVEKKVRDASKKYMIFYKYLTPIVYTSVVGDGVKLSLRYLCQPRKRRDTIQTFWEAILKEFSKHEDINLAYGTMRIINDSK